MVVLAGKLAVGHTRNGGAAGLILHELQPAATLTITGLHVGTGVGIVSLRNLALREVSIGCTLITKEVLYSMYCCKLGRGFASTVTRSREGTPLAPHLVTTEFQGSAHGICLSHSGMHVR